MMMNPASASGCSSGATRAHALDYAAGATEVSTSAFGDAIIEHLG